MKRTKYLPNGTTYNLTVATEIFHMAIAPHLGTTADYGRPSFAPKNW